MKLVPSLTRRIALTFLIVHLVVLTLALLVLRPFVLASEDADVAGPEVAAHLVARSVTLVGRPLAIVPDNGLRAMLAESPRMWAVVKDGRRVAVLGPIPPAAARIANVLPPDAFEAKFRVPGVAAPLGDAALLQLDSRRGRVAVIVGGVDPAAITAGRWVQYLLADGWMWGTLFLAVIAIPAVLLAAPLALRRLRPLVAEAAAIKPASPDRRLSLDAVPSELRPLVNAFNAALDDLAAELERRRRFIADVSHELRTPLAILALHVDALPDGPAKTEINRLQFRLTQMIGQMLDAQRLAVLPARDEVVDLAAVAAETVADLAPLAIREGYAVALTGGERPILTRGEPHAIGRALANLIGNAIAHGGGAGQIEVRLHPDLAIDVIDEGPGVAVEARERIFLPFSRERWDRDGCGLGLHLVREIMRAHGGEVSVIDGPHGHFRLMFARVGAAALPLIPSQVQ